LGGSQRHPAVIFDLIGQSRGFADSNFPINFITALLRKDGFNL
jgi:hypothetical protein